MRTIFEREVQLAVRLNEKVRVDDTRQIPFLRCILSDQAFANNPVMANLNTLLETKEANTAQLGRVVHLKLDLAAVADREVKRLATREVSQDR